MLVFFRNPYNTSKYSEDLRFNELVLSLSRSLQEKMFEQVFFT